MIRDASVLMDSHVKHACRYRSSILTDDGKRMRSMGIQNLSSRGERIDYAIRSAGLKAADVARLLHVTRSAVNQWVSDRTKDIKLDHLFGLEDMTGFSARWLATGKGPQRAALSQSARILDEEPREIVQETLDFMGYKITASKAIMTQERAAKYLKWIDALARDLQTRRERDQEQ